MKKRILTALVALSAALPSQSCSLVAVAKIEKHGYEFLYGKKTNLHQSTNAAIDYLTSRARHYLEKNKAIKVFPINNSNAPNLSSDLSQTIQNLIKSRLYELGYTLHNTNSLSTSETKRTLNKNTSIYWIKGSYTPKGEFYNVKLSIGQTGKNIPITSFTYNLPQNKTTRKLDIPKASIKRL